MKNQIISKGCQGYSKCNTCDTIFQHPVTGYCVNDHDDWVVMTFEESNERLSEELKRQKANGKKFVSNEQIENLINQVMGEEGYVKDTPETPYRLKQSAT